MNYWVNNIILRRVKFDFLTLFSLYFFAPLDYKLLLIINISKFDKNVLPTSYLLCHYLLFAGFANDTVDEN